MHITRCPIGLPKEYSVSACLPFVSGSDRVHLNKCLDNRRRGVARSVGRTGSMIRLRRDGQRHPPPSTIQRTIEDDLAIYHTPPKCVAVVVPCLVRNFKPIITHLYSKIEHEIPYQFRVHQPTTTPRRGQQHGGTFQRDIWWAPGSGSRRVSIGRTILN